MDVFLPIYNDLGLTHRVYHEIDVSNARLICQHFRRIPYNEKQNEVAKQTRKLIKIGIVKNSN